MALRNKTKNQVTSTNQLALSISVNSRCRKCRAEIVDRQKGAIYCSERCNKLACKVRRKRRPGYVDRPRMRKYERARALILELKSVPCMDCRGVFPPICMDFDHRDPSQKLSGVGSLAGRSLDRIREEAAKCDVICSNCHRIRTAKQQQWGKPMLVAS